MAKTESTLDLRKRQWFQQNVVLNQKLQRTKSVTTDKSNSINNQKSSSSGSKLGKNVRSLSRTSATRQTIDSLPRKKIITGFTVHFSLSKAMKSIRRQEKEMYRPTITPQKMQPPPQTEKKKTVMPKKKKPMLKRFVFDHENKSWRPEMVITNQEKGIAEVVTLPLGDTLQRSKTALSCYPNILSSFRKQDFGEGLPGLQSRRPSTTGSLVSESEKSLRMRFVRSRQGSESNISVSDVSVTSEGDEETDTSRSETGGGRDIGAEINTPLPIIENDESEPEDGDRPETSIEPLYDAYSSPALLLSNSEKTPVEVVKMKFLTSQGSKIMIKKRKIAPKKDPKVSDSEDTENEREDYPGCKYLYRLVHCRAVSNPDGLRNKQTKSKAPVGVIEIYTGHEDDGLMSSNRTCPYCIIEPGKRIARWMDCTQDSQHSISMYTQRDLKYYCQPEKRIRGNRKSMAAPSGLMPIPEV